MNKSEKPYVSFRSELEYLCVDYVHLMDSRGYFSWEDVTPTRMEQELCQHPIHKRIFEALFSIRPFTPDVQQELQGLIDEYAKANVIAKAFIKKLPKYFGSWSIKNELDEALFRDEPCRDKQVSRLRKENPNFLGLVYLEGVRELYFRQRQKKQQEQSQSQ